LGGILSFKLLKPKISNQTAKAWIVCEGCFNMSRALGCGIIDPRSDRLGFIDARQWVNVRRLGM
jgi:hypothetical protein